MRPAHMQTLWHLQHFYRNVILHFSILLADWVWHDVLLNILWKGHFMELFYAMFFMIFFWLKTFLRKKHPLMLHWMILGIFYIAMSTVTNKIKTLRPLKFDSTTLKLRKKQVVYSQISICYDNTFSKNTIKHMHEDDVQTTSFYDCHMTSMLGKRLRSHHSSVVHLLPITKMSAEIWQIWVCWLYGRTECWYWSNNWRYWRTTYSNWETWHVQRSTFLRI